METYFIIFVLKFFGRTVICLIHKLFSYLKNEKFNLWSKEMKNSVSHPRQSYSSAEEYNKDEVGEDGGDLKLIQNMKIKMI